MLAILSQEKLRPSNDINDDFYGAVEDIPVSLSSIIHVTTTK